MVSKTEFDQLLEKIEKLSSEVKKIGDQTTLIGQKNLDISKQKNFEEEGTSQSKVIFIRAKVEDVKLQDVLEFDGELDAEAYMDWERIIERVFEYASSVFENIQTQRGSEGKPHINTWSELKAKLKKFLP